MGPSFFQSGVLRGLERALCRPSALDALCLKPRGHVLCEITLSLPAEIDAWDPEPLYLSRPQLEPPSDLVPGQNRVAICRLPCALHKVQVSQSGRLANVATS